MQLEVRKLPFEIPRFSLTGDILSFRRCGLQYRYYSGSALPPSRPVQLWTGEFIHGVMEEAYAVWNNLKPAFPWPVTPSPWPRNQRPANRLPYDIGLLGDNVEDKLKAANKIPRSRVAREAAYKRVTAALNLIGPHLFELIESTEQKISGTRMMPQINAPLGQYPRGDRYELMGIVDVISSVSLVKHAQNLIVKLLKQAVPSLSGDFEVIVDYKGARRPASNPRPKKGVAPTNYWEIESWQVQTYSWLRNQQPGHKPISAGILIYVNELSPSDTDMKDLISEIQHNETDIVPISGSADYYAIQRWQPGQPITLSDEFKLKRAIRIVGVSPAEVSNALSEIDRTIGDIELCALNENATGNIPNNWPSTGKPNDCVACDFRRFCPSQTKASGKIVYPSAPG
jgi:hypothetical protein